MKYCLFQWRKEIIRFYSDRISFEISKDKIRNFLFSSVKLYDLKITYTQSILQWKPKSIVAM